MLSEEREVLEYIKEAFRLRSENLYKQAVEMLYKALTLDNDNIEILYQLGELYVLMHNPTKALGYLEKVLSKQPQHIECLKLVSRIHMENNEYENALIFALKVFELEKKSENLIPLIKIYGNLKMFEKIDAFSEYADENTNYEIAKILYKNGKINEAENKLQQCGQSENAKILLGKIYFDKNDLDKSREIFSSFPNSSENPDILNYKGLFELEDMKFIDAIKCFSKATNLDKNNPIYFYNLANAYFFNGWMKEAQNAYAKAIYLAPNNMDYRYSLAYLYYETKDFDKCKKEVETILTAENNHSRAKVLKALLLNNEKSFMEAKNILESCIENDDNFTLVSLAKTYVGLDMFKKAEEILLKLTEKNPDNFDYISDLSDVYIKENDFAKALEPAQKLIKQNPNYIYGYVLAAKASYLIGDMQNTKKYAQEAISLDMNCSDGYYYLAMVRFNEKDYDEAIECMKRAIIYNAANPEYYAQMSKIYKEKDDIKTALDYISEAESIAHSAEYQSLYKELAALRRKL